MELNIKEITVGRVVVTPSDRIDAFTAPQLRAEFDLWLARGLIHFVLDLTDVGFLDSSGLAALVSLLKRARQAGGDVKLILPRAEIAQRILKLTKFDRVFDLATTVDDALLLF